MGYLPRCDKTLYTKGHHIATIHADLKPSRIENIVKTAARKAQRKIDWHYFGGRAVVLATKDTQKVREYLKRELAKNKVTQYRFTTENDSVIPWPIN